MKSKTNSETTLKNIKTEDGVIYVDKFEHELKAYKVNKDNPLHCLHLGSYFGEKIDIAIYPDSITIQSKNYLGVCRDGFTIKFTQKINFRGEIKA